MTKRFFAGLTALLLLLPLTVVMAQDFSVPENMADALQVVYDDERYARAMYEGLAEKFGETPYTHLIRSEGRHAAAARRVAERNGITLVENPVDITLPDTEEEGVQMAIQYEKEDIAMLEKMIAKDYAPDMNRMLSNLKRGSEFHEQHMIVYAAALADGTADDWTPLHGCPVDGTGLGREFGRRWIDADSNEDNKFIGRGRRWNTERSNDDTTFGLGMHRGGHGNHHGGRRGGCRR